MNKTEWKPIEEIVYLLDGKDQFTILSCSFCANLSGTGGTPGLHIMKKIVKALDKKVVKGRVITACCEEYMMARALEKYKNRFNRAMP